MAFGAVVSTPSPSRAFVLTWSSQLPMDSPWSSRIYEFDAAPSGEVSGSTAVGRVTWPADQDIDPDWMVAWDDGADHWVAAAEYWDNATMFVPGPIPAQGADRRVAATWVLEDGAFGQVASYIRKLSTGDVNGDGIPDLAIGQKRNASAPSRVLVHTGPFLPGVGDLVTDAAYTFEMYDYEMPLPLTSSVGSSTPFLHDMDGDGAAEVMIASTDYVPPRYPGVDLYDYVSNQPGAMLLWTGVTPGAYGAGSETAIIEGTCEARLFGRHGPVGAVGPDPGRTLVAAVASGLSSDGLSERGAVFLMDLQGVTGTVNITDVSPAVILGDGAYDTMDEFAPLGDLNGDGRDDFVITSRWAGGTGRVYVFLGPVEGVRAASTADLVIEGGPEDGVFGANIATWDADGDGLTDLLVGAYLSDYGGMNDSGAVHSFSGAAMLAAMTP
ncbi:MAG: VCBS repeat-containing protein [Myxococcota bacterium]